ncbi:hypothetical protein [Colwellia hornerae]|uniref:LPP20 family lipoprotein n=1 Tax=Colwellia hornerae TaxID=89402 RepID=A0A5C6QSK8_9GAMM|nr:hypothetical protein [Colwellia hornerae]TWX56863.1 hypothetical protein ESZ28_03670 [Colwellia hornerae]TWX62412.1 hypothetical protein ESZ26_03220 [Colwellia hornerae]TWX72256.1 hypothetical protein ESZ27_00145 [Colwellia hornerae]
MKKTSIVAICLLIGACSSTNESTSIMLESTDSVPAWVLNPNVDNALAAASCVPWSGNLSIDKAQSLAMGRAEISQQINLKVSVLDKMYQRKLETDGKQNTGGTFEQVSKQISQQTLVNTKADKVEFAKIDGKKQLCTLVTLSEAKSDLLFEKLVSKSGNNIDPTSKAALYEEFRAKKASEELEVELQKLNAQG